MSDEKEKVNIIFIFTLVFYDNSIGLIDELVLVILLEFLKIDLSKLNILKT